MNKRGFLRILEASIAIVIIFGVLFVFFNQQQARTVEQEDLSERARDILDEIAKDTSLRDAVLNNGNQTVHDFISSRIPEAHLDFRFRICGVTDACGIEYISGNVYSAERTISSTISELGPDKIRLFIFEAN